MMSNLKTLYFLGLTYLIVPVIILIFLTVFAVKRIPDSSQEISERLVPITRTHPVTQSIIPVNNGFNTVVIYLRNKMLLNTDPLIFYLTDTQNQVLRQLTISGRNIGDGETIRFQFPPLSDSAGKLYTIRLEAPQTNFGSNIIEAGFSNSDTYPEGSSQDIQETGDLSFQFFYRPESKLVLLQNLFSRFVSQTLSVRFLVVFPVTLVVLYFLYLKFLQSGKSHIPADR